MIAFGAVFGSASPSLAQQQVQLQRVEITGSAIKRVQAEGPSPIQVVTRKDIERTGATSVNELLRSIAAVDTLDIGELSSNSPTSAGTAFVRLRGLPETDVLVLLNGRRLPINALHDGSGAGAAVDLNMIPLSAIERIDILKDGASAIYGADAVAGVFNVITRSDYAGKQAYVGAGTSSRRDGEEYRAGVSAGFGDLATDKYNLLLTLDHFKREPILRKDREISRSSNFTRFGGGNSGSFNSPYGNIISADFTSYTGEQVRPCPAAEFDPNFGLCVFDLNASLLTMYNAADRLSAMAIGTVELSPGLRLNAEFLHSQAKDFFQLHPVPSEFLLPDGRFYSGRFMQGGPREINRRSDMDHLALGLQGSWAEKYDWSLYGGQGTSRVTNRGRNYYDANLWFPALFAGQIDATVSTNDPAFVESLKITPFRSGKSQLRFLDLKLSGPAFKLATGDLHFAVGASVSRESLIDSPDALTQADQVVGDIKQAPADASRQARAVFGELQIPLRKDLEAQLALRHDDYERTGSQTSPKVALRYQPMSNLALRGSYSESFKAPRLKQLYGGREEGAITIVDRASCDILGVPSTSPCLFSAFSSSGSNPELEPEKGKTFNVGLVFEPTAGTSVSADLWRIEKSDAISQPTIAAAIQQGLFEFDTTSTPPRTRVFINLRNIAYSVTQGVDIDGRMRWRTESMGEVSVRNALTYTHKNRTKGRGDTEWAEFSGTYLVPRFRNAFSVTAEKGPWATTVAIHTTGGFHDSNLPLNGGALDARKVSAYEELHLNLSYAGIKGLTLSGGIQNLLDRQPPFSDTNASADQYTRMGFAELYTARGRYFYANAKYEF